MRKNTIKCFAIQTRYCSIANIGLNTFHPRYAQRLTK